MRSRFRCVRLPRGEWAQRRVAGLAIAENLLSARAAPDLEALMSGPVAACASRHGVATLNVSLEIETTGREIVDVRLIAGAYEPAFASCAAVRDSTRR